MVLGVSLSKLNTRLFLHAVLLSFQMEFHHCYDNEYKPKELKADLIFICHVMYHCINDYYDVIKRALSWLQHGGVLINVCDLATKYTDFFGKIQIPQREIQKNICPIECQSW